MTRVVVPVRIGSRALAALGAVLLVAAATRVVVTGTEVLPYPPEPREWVLAGFGLLIGVRVVAYAPRNPVGWLLLATGLMASFTALAATFGGPPAVAWLRVVTLWPVYACLIVTAAVFPGTRQWLRGRQLAGLLVAVVVAALAAEVGFATAAWADPVGFLAQDGASPDPWLVLAAACASFSIVVGGIGTAARMVVYGRRSDARTRRALAWTSVALLLLVVANALDVLGLPLVWALAALAFPTAALLAIVRYGFYEIDLLVHRSLLYGVVTVVILALYTAVVAALAGLVPAAAAAAATAVTVVVVQPVRTVAQSAVDRLIYGERREPYRVLTRVGASLEGHPATATAATALDTIVDAVGSSLGLPSAAILRPGTSDPIAEYGVSRGRPAVRVPVQFQGRHLADLRVEQRSPDESLTRPEIELVENLARQAGAVVHAVQLATELQRSRERIVLAREEERRRLRRDLHDGLGPSLTGIRLQLLTVRRALPPDSPAEPGLSTITDDMRRSVTELGSVIDGLRPPALDAGLGAAIETEVERFAGPTAPSIEVSVGELGRLPAAVEVAALRIASEALTNVVRHARSRRCRVGLHRADVLILEIDDDGVGLPPQPRDGVGLSSMRERAVELGGTLIVGSAGERGCRVRAELPLPSDTDRTAPRPPAFRTGRSGAVED